MKTKRATKTATLPLVLTPREEEILRAVSVYRFVTVQDITHLFFSRGSVTYARRMLSRLSGGRDYQEREYLFRFPLPSPRRGSPENVYTLGALGREVLESLGQPVAWDSRPSTAGRLSHSFLSHQLLLTRAVCAAAYWCRVRHAFSLVDMRLCYELARHPLLSQSAQSSGERGRSLAALPDAWLLVERVAGRERFPILLEIDRATEYQEQFRTYVKARLAFLRSGDYATVFGTRSALICYLTTGQSEGHRETRVKTMAAWTQDVLSELKLERWAGIFRFTSAIYETLYEDAQTLFETPVWYRPDSPTPGLLFGA
jgi:hypothetical protein